MSGTEKIRLCVKQVWIAILLIIILFVFSFGKPVKSMHECDMLNNIEYKLM